MKLKRNIIRKVRLTQQEDEIFRQKAKRYHAVAAMIRDAVKQWLHDAMSCNVHHARRHYCSKYNGDRSYDKYCVKGSSPCSHCRLQDFYRVITHAYKEVEDREAEQEDDYA